MVAFRRILVAALATVLFAGACTSINLPTIPPINVPPINLPSIPPINIPGFTIPPIVIPGLSIPPIGGEPSTTPCQLVTAAEVTQIMGGQVTDQSNSGTDCAFILPNFSAVSVQTTTDTDLSGVQLLMGQTAQQSTIGGLPALSGAIFGQSALYVQKGGTQLQVLGILTGTDPTTAAKLQQIATIAVGRMP